MKKAQELREIKSEEKMSELDVINQKCEIQKRHTSYDKKYRKLIKIKLRTLTKKSIGELKS